MVLHLTKSTPNIIYSKIVIYSLHIHNNETKYTYKMLRKSLIINE